MPLRYTHEDEIKIKNFMLMINNFSLESIGRHLIHFDETVLRYYNEICPMCRQPIKKNFRNEMTSFGSVGFIPHVTVGGIFHFYVICKQCNRDTNKKPLKRPTNFDEYIVNKKNDPKEQSICDYVYERLKPRKPRPHNVAYLPKIMYDPELIDDMDMEMFELDLEKDGFVKNSFFLDHFNSTCPLCKEGIPSDRDGYLDVNQIFLLPEGVNNEVVAFALCKKCDIQIEYTPLPKDPINLALHAVLKTLYEPVVLSSK